VGVGVEVVVGVVVVVVERVERVVGVSDVSKMDLVKDIAVMIV
jgi:hypothetical protein